MHHGHTLGWLIDQIADGNPVAWILFLGTVAALGMSLVYDLRRSR